VDRLYYLEYDPSLDPPYDTDWCRKQMKSKRCCGRGCGSLQPRFCGQQVDIPLVRTPRKLLEFPVMAAIVHRSLLDLLLPHLRGQIIGKCYLRDSGEIVPDYATVYTPLTHSIYLRGGPDCEYRICPTCGLPALRSDGSERQVEYFARTQLGPSRHAYQMDSCGDFLVSERLRDQIDWRQFRRLRLYEYEVRDRPIDGRALPGDPDYIANCERN
jgi:hypothetical protein